MSLALAIQETSAAGVPHTAGARVTHLRSSNLEPRPIAARDTAPEDIAQPRRRVRASAPSHEAIFNLVRSHVIAHIGRRLSAREIVAVTGVSHSTVHRAVVAETGQQLSQFIANLRLDQAHAWLSTNRESRTIAQIAAALGYKSAAVFSRNYRRRFGEVMSETRRRAVNRDYEM